MRNPRLFLITENSSNSRDALGLHFYFSECFFQIMNVVFLRWFGRQVNRQIRGQMGGWIDREMDRQIDGQMELIYEFVFPE